MTKNQERLRRAPVERFAGPEHAYDLAAIARGLRAEPRSGDGGHRQITIAHHGHVALVLFDFEADGHLRDHVAHGLVTIQTLDGHVHVRTPDAEHELPANHLLVLSPGVAHDVRASMPSQILLTVHLEADP